MDFLTQAYLNNWTLYERALRGSPSLPHWDLCVLTAANERQARAYEMQLEERREMGVLPPNTRWLVVPDVEGVRIGSGGATLHALLRVLGALEPGSGPGGDPAGGAARILQGRRVLVIHSGGDSKRLPHYSAFGKLFARVPHELPDGRASTLFDEFVVSLSGVPLHMHEGVVVASGDVLLVFDHMQLDFSRQGVVGVGMRVSAEVGTGHGVFVTDRDTGLVRRFLHKPSMERMEREGALEGEGCVDVDTGIVWMDPEMVGRWVELAEPGHLWEPLPEGMLERLVSQETAVNLYGDFLGVLAQEVERDEYLWDESDGPATEELRRVRERIWEKLRGSSLSMESLRPARFVHFGSTAEYREAMRNGAETYGGAGWGMDVLCSVKRREDLSDVVVMASLADGEEVRVGPGSVLEDSDLRGSMDVGAGCMLAGVRHTGPEVLSVKPDLVVHMLPVRMEDEKRKEKGKARGGGEGVVARLYGVYDNPKLSLSEVGTTFLNRPWREWLDASGISERALWGDDPPELCTLWNARLYPVASCRRSSWQMTEWMQRPEQATEEEKQRWLCARRLSLEESYLRADLGRVLSEARVLEDEVRIDRFLEALREERFSEGAAPLLGIRPSTVQRRVERVIARLEDGDCGLRMADGGMEEPKFFEDALFRMRGWKGTADALARITGWNGQVLAEVDRLEEQAFERLAELIRAYTPEVKVEAKVKKGKAGRRQSQPVVAKAPSRMDFGGGWSDTPPHSIERGGTVLNAAVELRGRLPIRVEAEFRTESGFLLESVDLGVRRRMDRPEDLLDCRDPSDPLALHKAALVLSGLHEHMDQGLWLSTEVAIPKGSGLGTSSIMAGAVLAALNRLTGDELAYGVLFDQVLCLEQMLTTGGGWQDQVGGLVGGIKLVTTEPGLPQTPRWTSVSLCKDLREMLDERFVLVYTGQRRLAKGILRTIMGRYMSRDPIVVGTLREVQDVAIAMRDALVGGDLEAFGKLMTRHWEANKVMDPGSTNPFIDQLFEQFDPYIVGGKLVGAGGGGFAELIARDGEAAWDLAGMLEATYPDGDVRVWPCRIAEKGLVVEVSEEDHSGC